MDLNKIGVFISALRKQKDMTQKELAEKIGITDKAVSRWETGKGFPDVSLLKPLAEALGVSISDIVMGEKIEIEKERAVEIMDNTVISTLDYSQREISKSMRWKYIAIASICAFVLLLVAANFYITVFGTFQGLGEMIYIMLMFLVIPIGTPIIIYAVKRISSRISLRKILWISPLVALAIGMIASAIFHPNFFSDLFVDYYDTSRKEILGFIVPVHCIVSVSFTILCYAVYRLRTRKG